MVEIMIPDSPSPYTVKLNNKEYVYPSGTLQTVPEEIADLIRNNEAEKPKQEPYIKEGADITVDSELSDESENPVQNKVITTEVNEMAQTFSSYIDDIYERIDKNEADGSAIHPFVTQSQLNVSEGEIEE